MSFLSKASFTSVSRVVSRVLFVVSQVLIARFFGVEVFGLYAISWGIIRIIWVFNSFGFQNGLIKFSGDSECSVLLIYSLVFSGLVSILFSALLFSIAPYLSISVFHEERLVNFIRSFSLIIPLSSSLTICCAFLRSNFQMNMATFLEDLSPNILLFICLAVGSMFSIHENILFISVLISYICPAAFILYFLKSNFRTHFDFSFKKDFTVYSIRTMMATLFSQLNNRASRLILADIKSASIVGVFQSAYQLVVVTDVLTNAIKIVFVPYVQRLFQADDISQLNYQYNLVVKILMFINFPILTVLFLFSDSIIFAIFGNEYYGAGILLKVMVIGQIFPLIFGPVIPVLIMTGLERLWSWFSLSLVVFNIGLGYLFIHFWSDVGAALVVSLLNLLTYCIGYYFINTKTGIVLNFVSIALFVSISVIVTFSVYFFINLTEIVSLLEFVTIFCLIFTSHYVIQYMFCLNSSDKVKVKNFVNR